MPTINRTRKPLAKKSAVKRPVKVKAAYESAKLRCSKVTEAGCLAMLEAWKSALERTHGKTVAIRKQKTTMHVKIGGTKLIANLRAPWTRRHPGTAPFLFDYNLLLSVYDAGGDAALARRWLDAMKVPLTSVTSR